MKRFLSIILASVLALTIFSSCNKKKVEQVTQNVEPKTQRQIVSEILVGGQKLSLEELAKRAIVESNGKVFRCIGNTSKGEEAMELFVRYLKSLSPTYNLDYEWTQENVDEITKLMDVESQKDVNEYSTCILYDGVRAKKSFVDKGIFKTFIPIDFARANNIKVEDYKGYLPVDIRLKIFMNTKDVKYKNCWDFVASGKKLMIEDLDTHKFIYNFLYTLTNAKYSKMLREAYEKLDPVLKPYYAPIIEGFADKAKEYGLSEDGKYALCYIKLLLSSYESIDTDDTIGETLVNKNMKNKAGFLLYNVMSKIGESSDMESSNAEVTAYADDYVGIGGYAYNGNLFVTDNTPLPWTSCAFLAYLTTTNNGFSPWGKEVGNYSVNPEIRMEISAIYKHEEEGDMGLPWWTTKGNVVIEDIEHSAEKEIVLEDFIKSCIK